MTPGDDQGDSGHQAPAASGKPANSVRPADSGRRGGGTLGGGSLYGGPAAADTAQEMTNIFRHIHSVRIPDVQQLEAANRQLTQYATVISLQAQLNAGGVKLPPGMSLAMFSAIADPPVTPHGGLTVAPHGVPATAPYGGLAVAPHGVPATAPYGGLAAAPHGVPAADAEPQWGAAFHTRAPQDSQRVTSAAAWNMGTPARVCYRDSWIRRLGPDGYGGQCGSKVCNIRQCQGLGRCQFCHHPERVKEGDRRSPFGVNDLVCEEFLRRGLQTTCETHVACLMAHVSNEGQRTAALARREAAAKAPPCSRLPPPHLHRQQDRLSEQHSRRPREQLSGPSAASSAERASAHRPPMIRMSSATPTALQVQQYQQTACRSNEEEDEILVLEFETWVAGKGSVYLLCPPHGSCPLWMATDSPACHQGTQGVHTCSLAHKDSARKAMLDVLLICPHVLQSGNCNAPGCLNRHLPGTYSGNIWDFSSRPPRANAIREWTLSSWLGLPRNTSSRRKQQGYTPAVHPYRGRQMLDDGTDEDEAIHRCKQLHDANSWNQNRRTHLDIEDAKDPVRKRPHSPSSSSSSSSQASDSDNEPRDEGLHTLPPNVSDHDREAFTFRGILTLRSKDPFFAEHVAAWASKLHYLRPIFQYRVQVAAIGLFTGVPPNDWQLALLPNDPDAEPQHFRPACLKCLKSELGRGLETQIKWHFKDTLQRDTTFPLWQWSYLLYHIMGFGAASFTSPPLLTAWCMELQRYSQPGDQTFTRAQFLKELEGRRYFLDSALAWVVHYCSAPDNDVASNILLTAQDHSKLCDILRSRLHLEYRVDDPVVNKFIVVLFCRCMRLYWNKDTIDATATEAALWQEATAAPNFDVMEQRRSDAPWPQHIFDTLRPVKLPPKGFQLPRSPLYPAGSGNREFGGERSFLSSAFGMDPKPRLCPDEHFYLSQLPHDRYMEMYPDPQDRLNRALPGASRSAVLQQRVSHNAPLTWPEGAEIVQATEHGAQIQLKWLVTTMNRSEKFLVQSLFSTNNRGERIQSISSQLLPGSRLATIDREFVTDLHQWVWAANSGTILNEQGFGAIRQVGGWFTPNPADHAQLAMMEVDCQNNNKEEADDAPLPPSAPPINAADAAEMETGLDYGKGDSIQSLIASLDDGADLGMPEDE